MHRSLAEGHRVVLDQVDTFADGVAVKMVGEEPLRICKTLVDEVVLVDTDETCTAIKDIFEDTRSITEPSGALAVAGAKKYLADKGLKNERVSPPPPTVDPTRLPNGGDAKSRQAFLPRPDAPAPERCRPSPRGIPSSPPPCSLRAEPRAGRDEAASGDRPVQAHRCARERGGVSCAVARRAHRSSLPPKSGGATPLAPPRAPVSPRVLRGRALPAGAQGSAKPWVGEARGSLA